MAIKIVSTWLVINRGGRRIITEAKLSEKGERRYIPASKWYAQADNRLTKDNEK